jgi:hypothetical protein
MSHKKGSLDEVALSGTEYESREFCRSVECAAQLELDMMAKGSAAYEGKKQECRTGCKYIKEQFIFWLMERGYRIDEPQNPDTVCSARTAYEYHAWLQENGLRIRRMPDD